MSYVQYCKRCIFSKGPPHAEHYSSMSCMFTNSIRQTKDEVRSTIITSIVHKGKLGRGEVNRLSQAMSLSGATYRPRGAKPCLVFNFWHCLRCLSMDSDQFAKLIHLGWMYAATLRRIHSPAGWVRTLRDQETQGECAASSVSA